MDFLDQKYQVHEKVGQGKQGVSVFRCSDRTTGRQYAVKRVPRALLGHTHGDERPMVAALRGLTQLVETVEVMESENSLDYVMELASGGDLFEWIATRGALEEDRARPLFAGVLAGLQQVHSVGLIHRDLKLENVLLMHPDPTVPEQVRLADFEFCSTVPATGAVGSIAYAAPEALGEAPYTQAVDVWAAGVMLYAMLSASAPFDAPEGPEATAQRIRETVPGMPFPETCWETISPGAKDLLNGMLHPHVQHRLTLEQVMAHPWFQGTSESIPASPISEARSASPGRKSPKLGPKFSIRCTWHPKMKRWGSNNKKGKRGPAADVAMLVDEDGASGQAPIIACPVEWAPRMRANSM